jgi:XRE family transcriptional regulator, aerobic/anaerobic benzoate catabolism transcriptional regulator
MSIPTPVLADLAQRVREERRRRGLSLRELAEASALSLRFLTEIESGRGNISVLKLAALARALGTAPSSLLERARPAPRVIALLGLRGAGKTTIGRRLARRLGIGFVELDRRIEQVAGLPLGEIFRLHGEAYYRRLEREALEQVLQARDRLVLATGGGIVTVPETFATLRRKTVTVWLRARPEDYWTRVLRQGDRRPIEARPKAMAELRRLLAAREGLYSQAAHVIDTSRQSALQAVCAIADRLATPTTGAKPRPAARRAIAQSRPSVPAASPGKGGRATRRAPSPVAGNGGRGTPRG